MSMEEIPDGLIIRNLAGESSPEEDRMLWEWIEQDSQNEKLFNDAVKLYSNQDQLVSKTEVEKRLGKMNLYTARPMPIRWMAAASLSLLGVVFAAMFLRDDRVFEKTSLGEVKSITLPDQSRVWLNGGTTINYKKNDFQKNRKIAVEGEAYFVIAKGSSPFMIHYDSIQAITDIGEVNIQAYPHELEKIAVVDKGSVTFRDLRKGSLEIIASTDHEVISRSDYGILARSINTNVNFKSWVTGIYVFNDEPIERVVSVMGKGNPDLKMKVDEMDRDRLISGVFQLDSTRKSKEEILRLIDGQPVLWK